MGDQRNLLLAIVISTAILFGYEFLFGGLTPQQPAPQATSQPATPSGGTPAAPDGLGAPLPPGAAPVEGLETIDRAAVVADAARVQIETPQIRGSILLAGGLFDDIVLTGYQRELGIKNGGIDLLSPKGTADPFFARFGWVGKDIQTPDDKTVWQADRNVLTTEQPVSLRWDNGLGLTFVRTISIDDAFLFTIEQRIENNGAAPVTLYPFALVSRTNTPAVTGLYILHEGPLGVFDGTLEEVDYDDLVDEPSREFKSTGGWLGITDKYWLTALLPNQSAVITARMTHTRDAQKVDRYQVDYVGQEVIVAPGESGASTSHFFTGAKEVEVLDRYEVEYGVVNFDLAIDFGWFYFLTKPIFYGLLWINTFVGNYGVSILILTLILKAILFPLANKSYRSMSKMKKLQPEMAKMRERFGDDKARLNQEMMALYKREKANPASGCLPILVQIPVFFALYKVLYVSIEMRHAPFFGWIQDLAAPDPTSLFNLFGLIPWTPPEFLMIGVWPLIMGISMFLQQRLNPQPPDPMQAKIMAFLPLLFTFLLASFPAGLVIYWAWNNTLSIAQQWVIMKKMGAA